MTWDERAEAVLAQLCGMVPETLRELASAATRDESEMIATERGGSEVLEDDVLRGWIRTTPPEQRNGLVAVIESLGFEAAAFAEELESAEGWDDEASASE